MLKLLYQTVIGRIILKVLTLPIVSKIVGSFLDSPLSAVLINPFLKHNRINCDEYILDNMHSFNDCFSRRVKPERRPIDARDNILVSPCDGYLSAYRLRKGMIIPVKSSCYSVYDLLDNRELGREYEDGLCLVFRLCVDNYHRYIYPDRGTKGANIHIPGVLHTVRPIALREVPVFTENSREYTILHTENFGDVIQMEVGAMLVGRIENHHQAASFVRGDEKGYFKYGGSTIILLLKKGTAEVNPKLLRLTEKSIEYPVKMGMGVGRRAMVSGMSKHT